MAFPESCPFIRAVEDNPEVLAACRNAERVWRRNLPVLGKTIIIQGDQGDQVVVMMGSEMSLWEKGLEVADGVLETIESNFCEECRLKGECKKLRAIPIGLGGFDVVHKVIVENARIP